jgi:hypothetical protein
MNQNLFKDVAIEINDTSVYGLLGVMRFFKQAHYSVVILFSSIKMDVPITVTARSKA